MESSEEEGVSQSVPDRECKLYLLSAACWDLKAMVLRRRREKEEDLI